MASFVKMDYDCLDIGCNQMCKTMVNLPPKRKRTSKDRLHASCLTKSDLQEIRLLKSIWLSWLPTPVKIAKFRQCMSSQLKDRLSQLDEKCMNPALTESCAKRALYRRHLKLKLASNHNNSGRQRRISSQKAKANVSGSNELSHPSTDGTPCEYQQDAHVEKTLPLWSIPDRKLNMPDLKRQSCEGEVIDGVINDSQKVPKWFLNLCSSGLCLDLMTSPALEDSAHRDSELYDAEPKTTSRVLQIQTLPDNTYCSSGSMRNAKTFIVTEKLVSSCIDSSEKRDSCISTFQPPYHSNAFKRRPLSLVSLKLGVNPASQDTEDKGHQNSQDTEDKSHHNSQDIEDKSHHNSNDTGDFNPPQEAESRRQLRLNTDKYAKRARDHGRNNKKQTRSGHRSSMNWEHLSRDKPGSNLIEDKRLKRSLNDDERSFRVESSSVFSRTMSRMHSMLKRMRQTMSGNGTESTGQISKTKGLIVNSLDTVNSSCKGKASCVNIEYSSQHYRHRTEAHTEASGSLPVSYSTTYTAREMKAKDINNSSLTQTSSYPGYRREKAVGNTCGNTRESEIGHRLYRARAVLNLNDAPGRISNPIDTEAPKTQTKDSVSNPTMKLDHLLYLASTSQDCLSERLFKEPLSFRLMRLNVHGFVRKEWSSKKKMSKKKEIKNPKQPENDTISTNQPNISSDAAHYQLSDKGKESFVTVTGSRSKPGERKIQHDYFPLHVTSLERDHDSRSCLTNTLTTDLKSNEDKGAPKYKANTNAKWNARYKRGEPASVFPNHRPVFCPSVNPNDSSFRVDRGNSELKQGCYKQGTGHTSTKEGYWAHPTVNDYDNLLKEVDISHRRNVSSDNPSACPNSRRDYRVNSRSADASQKSLPLQYFSFLNEDRYNLEILTHGTSERHNGIDKDDLIADHGNSAKSSNMSGHPLPGDGDGFHLDGKEKGPISDIMPTNRISSPPTSPDKAHCGVKVTSPSNGPAWDSRWPKEENNSRANLTDCLTPVSADSFDPLAGWSRKSSSQHIDTIVDHESHNHNVSEKRHQFCVYHDYLSPCALPTKAVISGQEDSVIEGDVNESSKSSKATPQLKSKLRREKRVAMCPAYMSQRETKVPKNDKHGNKHTGVKDLHVTTEIANFPTVCPDDNQRKVTNMDDQTSLSLRKPELLDQENEDKIFLSSDIKDDSYIRDRYIQDKDVFIHENVTRNHSADTRSLVQSDQGVEDDESDGRYGDREVTFRQGASDRDNTLLLDNRRMVHNPRPLLFRARDSIINDSYSPYPEPSRSERHPVVVDRSLRDSNPDFLNDPNRSSQSEDNPSTDVQQAEDKYISHGAIQSQTSTLHFEQPTTLNHEPVDLFTDSHKQDHFRTLLRPGEDHSRSSERVHRPDEYSDRYSGSRRDRYSDDSLQRNEDEREILRACMKRLQDGHKACFEDRCRETLTRNPGNDVLLKRTESKRAPPYETPYDATTYYSRIDDQIANSKSLAPRDICDNQIMHSSQKVMPPERRRDNCASLSLDYCQNAERPENPRFSCTRNRLSLNRTVPSCVSRCGNHDDELETHRTTAVEGNTFPLDTTLSSSERVMQHQLKVLSYINQILSTGFSQMPESRPCSSIPSLGTRSFDDDNITSTTRPCCQSGSLAESRYVCPSPIRPHTDEALKCDSISNDCHQGCTQFPSHSEKKKPVESLKSFCERLRLRSQACKSRRNTCGTNKDTFEMGVQTNFQSLEDSGVLKSMRKDFTNRKNIKAQETSETSDLTWGCDSSLTEQPDIKESFSFSTYGCLESGTNDVNNTHIKRLENLSSCTQTQFLSNRGKDKIKVNKKCQVGRSKVCSAARDAHFQPPGSHSSGLRPHLKATGMIQSCRDGHDLRMTLINAHEFSPKPVNGTIEICADPITIKQRTSPVQADCPCKSRYTSQTEENTDSSITPSDTLTNLYGRPMGTPDIASACRNVIAASKDRHHSIDRGCPQVSSSNSKTQKQNPCADQGSTRRSPVVHIRYRSGMKSDCHTGKKDEMHKPETISLGNDIEKKLTQVIKQSLELQREILRLQKNKSTVKPERKDKDQSETFSEEICNEDEANPRENRNSNANFSIQYPKRKCTANVFARQPLQSSNKSYWLSHCAINSIGSAKTFLSAKNNFLAYSESNRPNGEKSLVGIEQEINSPKPVPKFPHQKDIVVRSPSNPISNPISRNLIGEDKRDSSQHMCCNDTVFVDTTGQTILSSNVISVAERISIDVYDQHEIPRSVGMMTMCPWQRRGNLELTLPKDEIKIQRTERSNDKSTDDCSVISLERSIRPSDSKSSTHDIDDIPFDTESVVVGAHGKHEYRVIQKYGNIQKQQYCDQNKEMLFTRRSGSFKISDCKNVSTENVPNREECNLKSTESIVISSLEIEDIDSHPTDTLIIHSSDLSVNRNGQREKEATDVVYEINDDDFSGRLQKEKHEHCVATQFQSQPTPTSSQRATGNKSLEVIASSATSQNATSLLECSSPQKDAPQNSSFIPPSKSPTTATNCVRRVETPQCRNPATESSSRNTSNRDLRKCKSHNHDSAQELQLISNADSKIPLKCRKKKGRNTKTKRLMPCPTNYAEPFSGPSLSHDNLPQITDLGPSKTELPLIGVGHVVEADTKRVLLEGAYFKAPMSACTTKSFPLTDHRDGYILHFRIAIVRHENPHGVGDDVVGGTYRRQMETCGRDLKWSITKST